MAVLIHTISPACYRQLVKDGVILLPSERNLRRLTSAITAELGISEPTIMYLTYRFSKLADKDKIVSMLLDEAHTEKRIDYHNGKFYGFENGKVTKSLLSIMVKSIAGKYRDIVAMSPIHNINAEILSKIWKSCLKVLTEIGFQVVITMTDGLEANVRFFKIVTSGSVVIENPYFKSQFIFFLFDLVHLFKNIYNNLVNYGEYTCPSFDDFNKSITAKFSHVHELYRLELSSPLQRAHKLTDKVLHPSSIEKTNVMLADRCFHECTINGLNFYGKRGHPEFLETAKVFTIFRQWFDFFNVKSEYDGQRTRNSSREAINETTMESSMIYLTKFIQWVEKWKESGKPGLSRNTFAALIHTMKGFRAMIPYLVSKKELDYILQGFISSDPLEGRFRWWRVLGHSDYLGSVASFLRAEKTIRIRSLVKDGFDMTTIKSFFCESEKSIKAKKDEVERFMEELDTLNLSADISQDEKSLVYYYAS